MLGIMCAIAVILSIVGCSAVLIERYKKQKNEIDILPDDEAEEEFWLLCKDISSAAVSCDEAIEAAKKFAEIAKETLEDFE